MVHLIAVPMYEHIHFLISYSEVFRVSNLHFLFVLKGWEVHLWTASVFCLETLNLMGHPTAVPIHENIHFLMCHPEPFGVMNLHSLIDLILCVCKELNF
jgi:hypothetical protein